MSNGGCRLRADEAVTEQLEERARFALGRAREQRVHLDADAGADRREQQLALAAEVGVDRPGGEPGGPGDVLQPGTFVPLLDEDLDRRREQAIAGRRVLRAQPSRR